MCSEDKKTWYVAQYALKGDDSAMVAQTWLEAATYPQAADAVEGAPVSESIVSVAPTA